MKKYLVPFVIFIYFIMLTFVSNQNDTFAQETMPLTITPIYPENQNPQTKGYFDVNVNSGEELSLSVELFNNTDTDIIVRLEPANAFTSHTGGMMYQKESESPDVELLDDAVLLVDYIQVEDNVTVPSNSSINVPIKITVPNSDGQTILGGLLISSKGETIEQQQEAEEGTANFTINTETVFAMAIQLNLPNSVDSNFQLGDAGFYGDLAQVYIEMINDAQKIQEEVSGTYSIENQDGEELFNGEFGSFKMAPKSKIRFPIQWGYETLEDGNYTLNIQGTGNLDINEAKEFTINNEDVEQFVQQSKTNVTVAKEDNGIPSWIWIAGVILVGMVMFLLGRRKIT